MPINKYLTFLLYYLISYVPLYLGAAYFYERAGQVWQMGNLLVLAFCLFAMAGKYERVLSKYFLTVLVFIVFAVLARTLYFLEVPLSDALWFGKIAIALVSVQLGWVFRYKYKLKLSELFAPAVCGLILALISQFLSLKLNIVPADKTYENAAIGVTGSVALFSAYLSIVGVLAYSCAERKLVRFGILSLFVLQIIATLRRTAWLAVIFELFFIFFLNKRARREFSIYILIVWIVSVLFAGVVVDRFESFILPRLQEFLEGDSTGSGRSVFYAIAFEGMLNCDPISCLLGRGTDGLKQLMHYQFGHAIGAHSLFLDFGITFGWVGLIAILVLFVSMGISGLRIADQGIKSIYYSSMSVIIIFGALSGVGFEPVLTLNYFLIGYGLASRRLE